RAPVGALDQALQLALAPGPRGGVAGDDALVAQVAGDAVDRLLRDPAHVDVAAPRLGLDLGQTRVLRAGLDQHFADIGGVVLDGGGDGIDAGDPLFLAHAANCRAQ